MVLYINKDGTTHMDWEGRDPDEWARSVFELLCELKSRSDKKFDYTLKDIRKKEDINEKHPGAATPLGA